MSEQVRVLHVDDDPAFVDLADTVFGENEEVDLTTATDMNDGFDLLERRQFDCVVSDYVTAPNGDAFVTTVSEEHPDLPVILFTGTAYDDIDNPEVRDSITDYLQKGSTADAFDSLSERIATQTDRTEEPSTDEWEAVADFDPRESDSVVIALVDALTECAGGLPAEASPLSTCIDVEAVGRIIRSATSGPHQSPVTIRLTIDDYVIAVAEDGTVAARSR